MSQHTSAVNPDGLAEPFTVEEVPWEEFTHGDRFGMKFQALSEYAGASQITVCMEVLAPGRQANQAHYHMLEEEHVFVLDGSMTVQLGDRSYEVGPGHYVCFPAGQQVGHALVNQGTKPCRYLVLGNPQPHDVMVYTESGRVHPKLMGESYRRSPTMDYWEGVQKEKV